MKNILIVESNEPLDGLDGSLFRRRECTLAVASSAKEALKVVLKERPDLVIHDSRVTDLAPEEFVEALHASLGSAELPILVVLGRGEEAREPHVLRAGASAVAWRPIDDVAFNMKVCELVGISLRRHVRTFVKMKVDASVGATTLFATISNISLGGVLIEGERQIQAGEILKLSFFLPNDDEAITVFARIIRETSSGTGTVRSHGCQFIDLSTDARNRIHAFVTSGEGDV